MIRDESYKIDVFESDEQDKVINEDFYEIYTVFKFISLQLNYHSTCLNGLKILDIGCGSGENCSMALNHGASYVVGVDLSANVIQTANSNFNKASIEPSKFLFAKANVFSVQSVELSLPSITFENFFDRVMSFWMISQAKNLNEVRELLQTSKKYLKPSGDMVLLFVNPLIIANFPNVKQLPRLENFRLVEVVEENDHYRMRSQILNPFTEEVIMDVNHHVYSISQINSIVCELGLQVKHSGNLELSQRDDQLSYPFEMISQEITKDTTMGYFMHIKKL
jgi:2-polyprenyl-3-methyl-5-hydroxy-6-metoxy-1,4-benzoquinol methylase